MKFLTPVALGILLTGSVLLSSCGNNDTKEVDAKIDSSTTSQPAMNQQKFGSFDGKDIIQYTLTNSKGMV